MAKSSSSHRNSMRYVVVVLLILVVGSLVVIYALSQDDPDSSTTGANLPATLPATTVPPTEAPQEVALQQQVRDWVLTVDGVTQVLTLDIDVPGDEPPLIYAELEVGPGHNNTSIPNQLVAKVNEVLSISQYSDFVVIMNDGTQVTEYTLNLETGGWSETVLTGGSSSTPSD